MTKSKTHKLIYDQSKNYNSVDFENATVKNLYVIAKELGVRDVKKCKKQHLIELILCKHNEAQRTEVQSVLNNIIDTVVSNQNTIVYNITSTTSDVSFNDQMKHKFNSITFFKKIQTSFFMEMK